MKKVLLVSGSLPPIRCGVGYYSARLSRELARQKLDFEILSTSGVDKTVAAPLLAVPSWRIWSLPKIMAAIKKSGAGIIHIQYPAVGYRRQLGINLLPYVLRLLRPRLRILITLHEYHQSRWIGRWRDFITVLPAHKIFVSNQSDKTMLGWLGRKVKIVPIAANLDVAKPNPQFFQKTLMAHGLDRLKPTLIFFGYAYPSKKLGVLLDALAEPQLQNFQALLLTTFNEKNDHHRELLKKIERLNQASPQVGITGFLEENEVSEILQEGKYFVMPLARPISPKSGTAIAAVQNGLIVISGGVRFPEITKPFAHLKNCFLLDEVNGQTVADAIAQLEKSPQTVRTILSGAAELSKYFSWPHIVSEHLKIYGEL